MFKPVLQRFVLRTSGGPLGGVYRGLYRSPARLARRWLPDDVIDVSPIRPVEAPGFVVGLSDIDLLAIVQSASGDVHVSTVAAIARLNVRLRALFPFFQYCFSVTAREVSLPAADHWLGVYTEAFRRRLPDVAGRVAFARCLALQHACRWSCRNATMPVLFGHRRQRTLVNHQRRAYRILRELAFGLGIVGDGVYREEAFAAWQRGVSEAAGIPLADAGSVATASGWYASTAGALAIWRILRDAALCWDRSGAEAPVGGHDACQPTPSWLPPVADAFRALDVTVVAGASGERESDEEAYLLVDDGSDVLESTVVAVARRWQECRARVPGVAHVAPLFLTPSILRFLVAVCPWRAVVLRERRDDAARTFADDSWPWRRHARIASLYNACRDFREDVQGTPDEIASLARFSIPRMLLEVTEGDAPAHPAAVHERFVSRFGRDAWGYAALREASYRLERDSAGLDGRIGFFAAGLPLADAGSERLLAAVRTLPPAAALPSLARSTPSLDALRGACGP